MVIAIDGYEANQKNRVGIGRYAHALLVNMYAQCQNSSASWRTKSEITFRIYLPEEPLPDMPKESEWWQYRIVPLKRFWTFIGLPFGILTDTPKVDVIFSPTHYSPRFVSCPRVMSVMDLSFLQYPEMFKRKDLHQLVHWTRYSITHATEVLTISEFSKNAIIDTYGIPKTNVTVTYPGITMENRQGTINNKQSLLAKYNISNQYILSVGTIQPRKNYERLIEAFSRLPIVQEGKPLDLVIIGKKGWLFEAILETPKRFLVENRVKFLDFVPDKDLPPLYAGAVCFALPSLYEGFGLPVLEAMTNKTIVVVSNVSSIPEIAGEAGIYVDPNDVGSIEKGLSKALEEKGTKEGKKRVSIGLDLAKKFTWERAAKETLRVLERAGENH